MVLRFNRYLYPALGSKDIKAITKDEVRDLLLEIATSRNETARRLLGLLSEVFRFAALRGYVEADPTMLLKGLVSKDSKKHYPYIANQLIFSYDIYANLSVFAQYSGKICMKD